MNLLLLLLLVAVGYFSYLMMTKKPLPFVKVRSTVRRSASKPKDKVSKTNMPLNELMGYEKIDYNLIWLPNHEVVAVLKTDKVNYNLDSPEEQSIADQALMRWLTSFEGDVTIYLQSRRLDLTSKMEEYDRMIERFKFENPKLADYGRGLREYLKFWQRYERYEIHRYLLIKKQIPAKLLQLPPEELEKRVWTDMERRAATHKAALERIGVRSTILNTDGIREMMYFALNRGLISQTRYNNMVSAEHDSIYSTTNTTDVKYIQEGELDVEVTDTQKQEAVGE